MKAPPIARALALSALSFAAAGTAAAAQAPFHGTPIAVPGVFEAEDYDLGGEGMAYHDTTSGNFLGAYRTDDVDVGAIPAAAGGGFHVGYVHGGDWVEYTLAVPSTAAYEIRLRLASAHPGPITFHLEQNGVPVTSSQSASATGGWHNYVVHSIPGVTLNAGTRELRIAFDNGALNLDRVEIRGQTPWGAAPAQLPGVIQAEDYDRGGEGIAYHDTTPGNVFGVYRGDDVDTGAIPGGGFFVGGVVSGEWVEYTVDVTQSRAYELRMRVASADTRTVRYHVELDGVDRTGPQTVPETGGWHSYITQTIPVGMINAGPGRVLRVSFDLNSLNLDRIELAPAGCVPPAITLQPVEQTAPEPRLPLDPVTMTAAASGTPAPALRWTLDGVDVPGAHSETLVIAEPRLADQGSYRLHASNSCGTAVSNPAFLDIPGCGPIQLEISLGEVLQERGPVCEWTEHYKASFPNVMGQGSFNLQVLAAAIAAVIDPDRPGPGGGYTGVRGWWRKYLEGELGMRPGEWAYGGRETFSGIYQYHNIAAVMAMNYEFRRRGWGTERALAIRWLRATFGLMAAAAIPAKPVSFHDRGRVDLLNTNYSGPWVPLAGMRTTFGTWFSTNRNHLFARALDLPTNGKAESNFQTQLRVFLEAMDDGWSQQELVTQGDVYGLSPLAASPGEKSQKQALREISTSGQLPAVFHQFTAGIRTAVPYHIIGWDGGRVTLMERNDNSNTLPTFGTAYFRDPRDRSGSEVHFLYPYDRTANDRSCAQSGAASVDPNLAFIRAVNGLTGGCADTHGTDPVVIAPLLGPIHQFWHTIPAYDGTPPSVPPPGDPPPGDPCLSSGASGGPSGAICPGT